MNSAVYSTNAARGNGFCSGACRPKCLWRILLLTWLLVLLLVLQPCGAETLAPSSGRAISENEILPADVLSRVELVRAELDLIRLEIGQQAFPLNSIKVLDTAPREVYFMAKALYEKADRLAFEYVKTSEQLPKLMAATSIRPYHVWHLANKTYIRLQVIKDKLLIPEKSVEKISDSSTTPSDVIQAMIKANQELGALLSQKFVPADVYQQVTLAINLNAQLLATFQGTERIPSMSALQRRKTPANVYRRLTHCFELVKEIAQVSNLHILRFDTESLYSGPVKASDVYGLATLMVAELSYFHALREQVRTAAKAYYPGRKTASEVFQRVGILEAQLEALLALAKKNPQWIETKS